MTGAKGTQTMDSTERKWGGDAQSNFHGEDQSRSTKKAKGTFREAEIIHLQRAGVEFVGRSAELKSLFNSVKAKRKNLRVMLVLGDKYSFTKLELKRLEKKFDILRFINYTGKCAEDVLSELSPYFSSGNINTVVLNARENVADELIRFLTKLQYEKQIKYISIESFLEKYLHKCYVPSSNNDLHLIGDIRPYTWWQYGLKRCVDMSSVVLMLLIFLPVILMSKKRLKAESPGSVFYSQKRLGKNNKEFSCVKFRSMRLDAEKDGVQFACKNDPRIFPWGEVMRKTRLDELPQLINILKGDMHLIGPRPERKHWTEQFEKAIPYYSERHLVSPGVTGWAQVMYPYGADKDDAKQKLMYDLYYMKHWSVALELQIIWLTALIIFGGKGL